MKCRCGNEIDPRFITTLCAACRDDIGLPVPPMKAAPAKESKGEQMSETSCGHLTKTAWCMTCIDRGVREKFAAEQSLLALGCRKNERGEWERLVNCTDCVEDEPCETCNDGYQIWKPILPAKVTP